MRPNGPGQRVEETTGTESVLVCADATQGVDIHSLTHSVNDCASDKHTMFMKDAQTQGAYNSEKWF